MVVFFFYNPTSPHTRDLCILITFARINQLLRLSLILCPSFPGVSVCHHGVLKLAIKSGWPQIPEILLPLPPEC